MDSLHSQIKIISAIIGGWLGWFLGSFDGFLYTLIALVIVDYITGVVAAGIRHELSSEVGFTGIAKKIMIFAIVGVANVLDHHILQQSSVLRTMAIFFYVANEGMSIVENANRIGIAVPRPLSKLLKQLREEADKNDDESN